MGKFKLAKALFRKSPKTRMEKRIRRLKWNPRRLGKRRRLSKSTGKVKEEG